MDQQTEDTDLNFLDVFAEVDSQIIVKALSSLRKIKIAIIVKLERQMRKYVQILETATGYL